MQTENTTLNLSNLKSYFPSNEIFIVVKDNLDFYFGHLGLIRLKTINHYIKYYTDSLKKYKIEADFTDLENYLDKHGGWFIDINK